MLSNFTFKTKLIFLATALLFLLSFVAAISLKSISHASENIDEIANDSLKFEQRASEEQSQHQVKRFRSKQQLKKEVNKK